MTNQKRSQRKRNIFFNRVFLSKVTKTKNELHEIVFFFEQSFDIFSKRRDNTSKFSEKLSTLAKNDCIKFLHILICTTRARFCIVRKFFDNFVRKERRV